MTQKTYSREAMQDAVDKADKWGYGRGLAAAEVKAFNAGVEAAAKCAAQFLPEKSRVNHTGDDYLDYVNVFRWHDGQEIATAIAALKKPEREDAK